MPYNKLVRLSSEYSTSRHYTLVKQNLKISNMDVCASQMKKQHKINA